MNPLLENTDDLDFLLKQADALNVDVRIDDDGKIKIHALSKTPAVVGLTKKLGQVAQKNRELLKYAVTKKGWPGVFNPRSPVDDVESMIPDTGAGKGAMAALGAVDAFAPEMGIPMTVLTDLLAGSSGGLLGGAVTGEPLGQSTKEGAISGATNLGLKGLFSGAKTARAWMKRPNKLDRDLMAGMGKVVADTIRPFAPNAAGRIATLADEFGTKGSTKNTVVRVLNSPEANDELEKHFQDTLTTVIKGVKDDAVKNARDLQNGFKSKYGFDPTKRPPKGAQVSRKMVQDVRQFKEAVKYASEIGPEMQKGFTDVSALSRGSYDADNELKHSYTAIKGVQNKTQLNGKLDEIIQAADPSGNLSNMLSAARDNYSKFKGFQDFVNIDKIHNTSVDSLDKKGQWFNPQTLQKAMDANTNPAIRFVQRRLKDAFEPLYNVVRRGAEQFTEKGNPIISDVLPFEAGARLGGNVPGIGARIFQHLQPPRQFTKFIGAPEKLAVKQGAGDLPVLLNSLVTKANEPNQVEQ